MISNDGFDEYMLLFLIAEDRIWLSYFDEIADFLFPMARQNWPISKASWKAAQLWPTKGIRSTLWKDNDSAHRSGNLGKRLLKSVF